jgi:hypothetical protein
VTLTAAPPENHVTRHVAPAVPRTMIPLVALTVLIALVATLTHYTGTHGRTWLGYLDVDGESQEVTTTDYQPVADPEDIVYPDDFPQAIRLTNLPDDVVYDKIDTMAVYRFEGTLRGYSIGGHFADPEMEGIEDKVRSALHLDGYEMSWWVSTGGDDKGQFWLKWTTT